MANRTQILIVQDCHGKMKSWTIVDLDPEHPEFYHRVGLFVMNALRDMALNAFEQGVKPCYHLVAKSVTEKELAALHGETAKSELDQLVTDVEQDNRS